MHHSLFGPLFFFVRWCLGDFLRNLQIYHIIYYHQNVSNLQSCHEMEYKSDLIRVALFLYSTSYWDHFSSFDVCSRIDKFDQECRVSDTRCFLASAVVSGFGLWQVTPPQCRRYFILRSIFEFNAFRQKVKNACECRYCAINVVSKKDIMAYRSSWDDFKKVLKCDLYFLSAF